MSDENKDKQLQDLEQLLLAESNPEKVSDLINLFNLNFAKKNAIRLDTISDLIDVVIDRVKGRLETNSDEFTNKDLIDYLSALMQAADKSGKFADKSGQIPAITFNQQNNVTVNTVDELTQESKKRIAETVEALLNNMNQSNSD